MTLQPGNTLGTYEIIEKVGAGGMGAVYKAYQTALGRYVAIKVLPPQTAGDPAFGERFALEARALGKLRHPHIVTAFDFAHQGDVAYLVSEFIDGGTLADQLGAPLPIDYSLGILTPIAAALDYAHARGVVHRDLKPQNILLTHDGDPVLTDFGLAKIVGPGSGVTQAGSLMGTAEYMAPECAIGAEAAGPAADQYALAIIAYEMLVGRHPFPSDNPLSALMAHVHKPVPPPSQLGIALPPGVEAALLRGLAKKPEERFARTGDLVRALAGATATRRDSGMGQSAAVAGATESPTIPPQSAPPMDTATPVSDPQMVGIASPSALVRPVEPTAMRAATMFPTPPSGGATAAVTTPPPPVPQVPPWWRRKRMLLLPLILITLVAIGVIRENATVGTANERRAQGSGTPRVTAPVVVSATPARSTAPSGSATASATASSAPSATATSAPTAAPTPVPAPAPTPVPTPVPTAARTPVPTDNYGNTPQTSTPINPGAYGGTISPAGDIDFFRFPVSGPTVITIEFRGTTLENGAVALFLASGIPTSSPTLIVEDFDTGGGAHISHTTGAGSATYLIRIRSGNANATGTYAFGLALTAAR